MALVVLRRLMAAVPALLGVSVIVFLLLSVLPGDPLVGLLAPDATQADRDLLAESLGLNAPLPVQYINWLTNIVQGDFGQSFSRSRPVSDVVGPAFYNTMILAVTAALIGVTGGVLLGTVAALKPGTWGDRLVSVISMTGLSIPSYWLAILLVIAFSVKFQWFPAAGMPRDNENFFNLLRYLTLPAVATASVTIGMVARTTRASLIATYSKDFVLTLQAKGLRSWQILKHVWKNAAPAVMTVAGLQVGYLFGGSVLVEPIFSWPGLGQLIFQSISARDLRVIQASVLLIAVTFVLVNLVVDLLQVIVDPRLRRAK
ncbi:MAG: ABC transporter permease [Elainellaceae cyanobacterium]